MDNEIFLERLTLLEKRIEKLELMKDLSDGNKLKQLGPQSKVNKKAMSINEFIKTKKVDDDVKRTLVIIYYLSYFGGPDNFTADEIRAGFRAAKYTIPKNVNDKINMNVRNGHLAEEKEKKDGKKSWYVTNSGAQFVEDKL